MLTLSPRGPKYVIVTIGTVILQDNNTSIKCSICGNICEGKTHHDQIKKLFECLGEHIPAEHLYEVYEQEGGKIISQIDKAVWDKVKRDTKYKP